MDGNSHRAVGGLLLLALVVGGILLVAKARSVHYGIAIIPRNSITPRLTTGSVKLVETQKLKHSTKANGLVRYKNTEIRDIDWDYDHMVPTRITITRESLQLP